MSQTKELIVLADELIEVVRQSVVDLAEACGGKDHCKNPNCMFHKVQRHKDPRKNPFKDLCYTSTMALYHLLEIHSRQSVSAEAFNKIVKLRRKDGPTGRRHSKGPVKHFWLDIEGNIYDPSFPQYVIDEVALPTYDNWDDYKQPKQTLRPYLVKPLLAQATFNIVGIN